MIELGTVCFNFLYRLYRTCARPILRDIFVVFRCDGSANQPLAKRVTGLLSDQQASSALVGNF